MPVDVLMPVLTAAGEDGVVTAWLVDEGGEVERGQLIAEVQVEKVAEDIHSPESGAVMGRVPVNQPVPQGDPICRIVESSAAGGVGVPGPTPSGTRDQRRTATRPAVPSSPAARRLARELGVDLATVTGSGPGGRITEADVRGAESLTHGAASSTLTGLRAVIARNMRRSHLETAPVTLTTEVELGEAPPDHITASVVRAVAMTLADHPRLNGVRDGDRFVPADQANISVAVQTESGLVTPVLRKPAARTVEVIDAELKELAERARSGSLTISDHEGGTFTVTNLGAYGIDGFTPMINLPQVAVLGVGAARRVPVIATDGSLAAGWRMVLSLTFDHAFVDGAPAAAFLRDLVLRMRGGD